MNDCRDAAFDTGQAATRRRYYHADGATIAYRRLDGKKPGIVFLGGFRSDMTGTKATALEAACRQQGRAFVRFDYFGHGDSSGEFLDGTIGRWRDDAIAVIDSLTEGRQILIGSVDGRLDHAAGRLARPQRIAGILGSRPRRTSPRT